MADALDRLALRSLAPLDLARARVYRALGPALGASLADRSSRVALFGGLSVVLAFVLVRALPIAVLALGPLLLGVPHLVADVRYLVLRRGLHRRAPVALLTLAPLLLAFLVPTIELAGLVTVGAALAARGAPLRRGLVAVLGLALLALGLRTGYGADVVFAHLHNLVALLLWWSLRPRTSRLDAIVPALVVLGVAALVALPIADPTRMPLASLLPLETLVATLAPVEGAEAALRWVLVFAFGQSVHYLVWLRLVPDELRDRPAPRSFASSYRALRSELGAGVLLPSIALLLALLAFACVDLDAARTGYLRLALFHGPLELGLAGLAFAEGRRP